jgi:hypothetical protein
MTHLHAFIGVVLVFGFDGFGKVGCLFDGSACMELADMSGGTSEVWTRLVLILV